MAFRAQRDLAPVNRSSTCFPRAPHNLRPKFDTLALVWSRRATRKPRWITDATAEMINHVLNNMFHGVKTPDDSADRELLDRINPILLGILGV